MDMTLVVMAAGLGSRYGGVKQIERLGPDGEILMEYAIYDALCAGFDRIVLIIKPQMLQDVRALFGDRIEQRTGVRIDYAFQTPDRFTAARPELAQRSKPLGHRARRAVRGERDEETWQRELHENMDRGLWPKPIASAASPPASTASGYRSVPTSCARRRRKIYRP